MAQPAWNITTNPQAEKYITIKAMLIVSVDKALSTVSTESYSILYDFRFSGMIALYYYNNDNNINNYCDDTNDSDCCVGFIHFYHVSCRRVASLKFKKKEHR